METDLPPLFNPSNPYIVEEENEGIDYLDFLNFVRGPSVSRKLLSPLPSLSKGKFGHFPLQTTLPTNEDQFQQEGIDLRWRKKDKNEETKVKKVEAKEKEQKELEKDDEEQNNRVKTQQLPKEPQQTQEKEEVVEKVRKPLPLASHQSPKQPILRHLQPLTLTQLN